MRSTKAKRGVLVLVSLTAAALAGAAAMFLLLEWHPWASAPSRPPKRVQFNFQPAPEFARDVFLVGDFNDWKPNAVPMVAAGDGVFEAVLGLPPGRYRYKFVAAGSWFSDERAALKEPDGHHGHNAILVVDDSFPDFDVRRGDGRINSTGLVHRQDAWELTVSASGTVTLATRAWAGDVAGVSLLIRHSGGVLDLAATPADTDGLYDYFEASPPAAVVGDTFSYQFVFADGSARTWLGPRGVSATPEDVGAFRYQREAVPAFETPEWARDAIIYSIFVDRFANGDPSNDQDFIEWYYEGALQPAGVEERDGTYFHLVRDWTDTRLLSDARYVSGGTADVRTFYGGDLEGIRGKLGYLADLGVTLLYLTPIFEARSSHKYDVASYTRIDPHFGTKEDLVRLVREAHALGLRVILDLPFNHTGHTFWAFRDARERGEASPYWSWYEWTKWPLPGKEAVPPASAYDYYNCWWKIGEFPVLNFDLSRAREAEDPIDRIDQAQPNAPLVEHLLSVAALWLIEADVDGFRLDVAGEVPFWFWERFRERVRSVKPDAYILAEYLLNFPEMVNGKYSDGLMNYGLREAVLDFIALGTADAPTFDRLIKRHQLVVPDQGVRAMMNMLSSHDTARFITSCEGDVRKFELGWLFAMTYVGSPALFYGDEIGLDGKKDTDYRKPFDWGWAGDPKRARLHGYLRALAHLRRGHPVFSRGAFETVFAEGRGYVYRRSLGDDSALVALNAGEQTAVLRIPLREAEAKARLVNPLTGDRFASDGDRVLTVTLQPHSGLVLIAERPVP